jgi:hypothetical protein
MKKVFKSSLLFLFSVVFFALTVMSCSAAEVTDNSIDTVGKAMARAAYEVEVSGEGLALRKNKTMQLTAEVKGVAAQPKIVWISSDEEIASVDENGVVKGKSAGRVFITAAAKVAGQTIYGHYSINVITDKLWAKDFLVKNQILSYKYDYVDDYFYTNDKKCWQDTFGYARIYDLAAPYIALEYDYTRVFFNHDGKDFMVQLWEGQYGYVFYGAEIGIYTKKASDKDPGMLTFYGKADEEYWPEMEMTIYHEQLNGEWEREFTRDPDRYWWCTGFKLGHLRSVEPADELRMIARITFKDAVMAEKFSTGLKDCGLQEVKNLNNLRNDNFYRKGATVHVRWQDISEAENTMPIKVTGAALLGFNFLAILLAGMFILGFGAFAIGLLILL